LRRTELIRKSGQVALSAHSQGCVIAAAVVTQMTTECARNVALLTYGCPLRRLYAVYFPAYFGVGALLRVGELLEVTAPPDPADGRSPWTRERRASWPWLNQYRLSDPIGGAIFVGYPAVESDGIIADIDWGVVSRPTLPVTAEVLTLINQRRDALGANAPFTFENRDVDWQLVDPRFARAAGDGAWPTAHGHSDYPTDPAFEFAIAIIWERRGAHVPP
jgi:hypothetical protein